MNPATRGLKSHSKVEVMRCSQATPRAWLGSATGATVGGYLVVGGVFAFFRLVSNAVTRLSISASACWRV
jgi:hypothetical protein